MKPSGPEMVITLAPSSLIFMQTPQATLPKPETAIFLPLSVSFLVLSISSMKYVTPKPVASGRMSEPPQFKPLPVRTPVNSFLSFL